jgi:hypothetical protein
MKLRSIPPNTLAAVAALIGPYAPDASPSAIIEALKAHGADTSADPTARKWLSFREAGKVVGKSEWSMRRLAIAGGISARKIGGVWRIPVSALDALSQADAE